MGMVKRAQIIVAFMLLSILALPNMYVSANVLDPACQDTPASPVCTGNNPGQNPIAGDDGLLTTVTTLIATITAITAVIIIVIAGLTMVLSAGNSQKVQSSRDAIIYALIALAVAALAQAVVIFVIGSV